MAKEEEIIGSYTISKFPKDRIPTLDFLSIGDNKHYVKGLIEVDVTVGRQIIANCEKETGLKLSFTAWLLKNIGEAASKFKEVHSILKGKRKIISFDDVDISIPVERLVKGVNVAMPVVLRKVNEKNVKEIHEEIRLAQSEEVSGATVLGENSIKRWVKFYRSLPKSIRRFLIKRLLKNPLRAKKLMGTIIVTAVGMFGRLYGWPIPTTSHPLAFAIGGITKKPGVVNDKIKIREYLTMTVLFNHDVVDGAPAARFINRLKELIESGYGLTELAK
ncbi:MAG: 2-oxo acid dehydrogenase subunit E2 [Promethearchaeota archaeon]|jgi:pyruvate/2-oxoglutarate dehydrogenase complex dihydrolipoamide acyltransferase (E2) component